MTSANQKKKDFSPGKAIDWLGLRLLLLGIFGVVAFAVIQPFVWQWALDKSAPVSVANLSSLVAVVVTIVSLALAGFGVTAYRLIMDRINEEFTKRTSDITANLEQDSQKRVDALSKSVQEGLQAQGASLSKDMEKRLTELQTRTVTLGEYALVKIELMVSYQAWQRSEEMWRQKSYDNATFNETEFREFLEQAIKAAEDAFSQSEKMAECEERNWSLQASKNTLAYHLATRQLPTDKERAIGLAGELEVASASSYHLEESVAWVYLRFGVQGDTKRDEAIQIAHRLATDNKIPLPWRDRLKVKYKNLFGLEWPEG